LRLPRGNVPPFRNLTARRVPDRHERNGQRRVAIRGRRACRILDVLVATDDFVVLRCPLDRQEPTLAPLHPDLGFRLHFEGRLIQTSEPNLDERVTGPDSIKQSRNASTGHYPLHNERAPRLPSAIRAVAAPDVNRSPRTLWRTAPQRHPPVRTPASTRSWYVTLRWASVLTLEMTSRCGSLCLRRSSRRGRGAASSLSPLSTRSWPSRAGVSGRRRASARARSRTSRHRLRRARAAAGS
jgi:hypothetical protein